MGRKSLRTERRAQILDACEAVVLEEGLAAASPARLAREVGLDRSTLHHYFRTRADLLAGLVERIVDGYLAGIPTPDPAASARPGDAAGEVLDFLLSPDFVRARQDRLVDEITAAAHDDGELRRHLKRLYETLEQTCVDLLQKTYPAIDAERTRDTARAVYALIEGALLVRAAGLPEDRLATARRAAQQLIRGLQA